MFGGLNNFISNPLGAVSDAVKAAEDAANEAAKLATSVANTLIDEFGNVIDEAAAVGEQFGNDVLDAAQRLSELVDSATTAAYDAIGKSPGIVLQGISEAAQATGIAPALEIVTKGLGIDDDLNDSWNTLNRVADKFEDQVDDIRDFQRDIFDNTLDSAMDVGQGLYNKFWKD